MNKNIYLGIAGVIVVSVLLYLVNPAIGVAVFIISCIAGIIYILREVFVAIVALLTVAGAVIWWTNQLPNPDRPKAELAPCQKAIARLGVIQKVDCSKLGPEDIRKLILANTYEFSDPATGKMTIWGEVQSQALLHDWPNFDYAKFELARLQYEGALGNFQAQRTEPPKGATFWAIFILAAIATLAGQVLSFFARQSQSMVLRVAALIVLPVFAGGALLGGNLKVFVPELGMIPTPPQLQEATRSLFWQGFAIVVISAIVLWFSKLLVQVMTSLPVGSFGGFIVLTVIYSLITGIVLAFEGSIVQSNAFANMLDGVLITNPQMTRLIAQNAINLGMLCGIGAIPIPGALLSLVFEQSD